MKSMEKKKAEKLTNIDIEEKFCYNLFHDKNMIFSIYKKR
jgi:hypothetical protein